MEVSAKTKREAFPGALKAMKGFEVWYFVLESYMCFLICIRFCVVKKAGKIFL